MVNNEHEIADILNIKQSGVNKRSTSAQWYAIDTAVNYFEQVRFSWKHINKTRYYECYFISKFTDCSLHWRFLSTDRSTMCSKRGETHF